jgi:hypothetical protein
MGGALFVILGFLLCGFEPTGADEPAVTASTVGMPRKIEQIVLPGSELEPIPVTDETLVVIRVDAVYTHGTAFRYDLVCYAVEPGDYDLRNYLRRKDGSPTADLPRIPFKVSSQLPAGQIEPHDLGYTGLPWLGGYRLLMILAGVVWVGGLVWILYPRKKKSDGAVVVEAATPLSLADRLRPLVIEAVAGRLPPAQLAELERALVSYWRRRLKLEELSPVDALSRLRGHPEASPLVSQLETWLHKPPDQMNVDIPALLEPYRNIAPDAL